MAESTDLKVLVIDADELRASIIQAGLHEAGHKQVLVVHDATGVAKVIEDEAPDVIVIDLANPNRDMAESIFALSRTVQRPIAMFVDTFDKAAMEAAIDAGVSAYVVDGLRKDRVKAILDMAVSRFNAYSRLQRELDEARSELASRKIIDRAKGIVMRSKGLDEDAAYALLRRTAMNQNRKLIEIARSLVTAAGILDD